MALNRAVAVAAAFIFVACPWLLCQKDKATSSRCDAPSYFGVCDPYVPGIIVEGGPKGGLLVQTPWPSGPADQAGVCPGDEVVSVNGILSSGRPFMDVIKDIVSDKPTPVDLTIKRRDQSLNFHLQRVRETELAALSRQKYVRLPFFPFGEQLVKVPSDESPQELQAFKQFEFEVGRRYGFKLAGERWVPKATDEEQFARLDQISKEYDTERLAGAVFPIFAAYQPGFYALLLKHPDQVLVYLVEPASPAFQAGLLPGDEILEVDGRSVSGLNTKQLADLVLKPDDHARQINLRLRRGKSNQTVKIETRKGQDLGYGFSVLGIMMPRREPEWTYIAGMQLVNPGDPRERVVREVTYPSAAFAAGIHVGDEILTVNGRPLKLMTQEQIEDLPHPPPPSPLRVDVSRLGKKIHFELTPMTEAQAQASIGRKMTAKGPASSRCPEPTAQP